MGDREELKSEIVPTQTIWQRFRRRLDSIVRCPSFGADGLMHGAGSTRESHKGSETLYAAVTAGTLAEAFLI